MHRATVARLRHLPPFRQIVGATRLARIRYLCAWRLWKYDPRYRKPDGTEREVSFIEPLRLWWRGELDRYVGHPLLAGDAQAPSPRGSRRSNRRCANHRAPESRGERVGVRGSHACRSGASLCPSPRLSTLSPFALKVRDRERESRHCWRRATSPTRSNLRVEPREPRGAGTCHCRRRASSASLSFPLSPGSCPSGASVAPLHLARVIVAGLVLQFAIAGLLLAIPASRAAFDWAAGLVAALQAATNAGMRLVFGYLAGGPGALRDRAAGDELHPGLPGASLDPGDQRAVAAALPLGRAAGDRAGRGLGTAALVRHHAGRSARRRRPTSSSAWWRRRC